MEKYIKLSFKNKEKVLNAKKCYCYYCKKEINKDKIEWLIEKDGKETALCPECMVDSVITDLDTPGINVDENFLKELNEVAFGSNEKHEEDAINNRTNI